MRRRAARIVLNLTVEVRAGERVVRGVTQDVTPFGMFVRLDQPLPIGVPVTVAIVGDESPLAARAVVVHALDHANATALGRQPGNGLSFVAGDDGGLVAAVIALIEASPQLTGDGDQLQILVADSSTRLLERLSTALGNAGFVVATAATGIAALAMALRRRPDVVLAARELPVIDGLQLLAEFGRYPELVSVPVMIVADESTDLIRLDAFQRGAMDFIPKPFTVLEIVLRARRLARLARRDGDRVVIRGAIAQLGLPSLFSMIELDRKTGVVALTRGDELAWLTFVDGQITRARGSVPEPARATVMRVLDWTDGYFELTDDRTDRVVDITESITHLLLDHARARDERSRAS
jgi:DNA-binding response OmpR family regulator